MSTPFQKTLQIARRRSLALASILPTGRVLNGQAAMHRLVPLVVSIVSVASAPCEDAATSGVSLNGSPVPCADLVNACTNEAALPPDVRAVFLSNCPLTCGNCPPALAAAQPAAALASTPSPPPPSPPPPSASTPRRHRRLHRRRRRPRRRPRRRCRRRRRPRRPRRRRAALAARTALAPGRRRATRLGRAAAPGESMGAYVVVAQAAYANYALVVDALPPRLARGWSTRCGRASRGAPSDLDERVAVQRESPQRQRKPLPPAPRRRRRAPRPLPDGHAWQHHHFNSPRACRAKRPQTNSCVAWRR